MKQMGLALRKGRVLWYNAARGYGFVNGGEKDDAVLITRNALEVFGVTGLHAGLEIVLDVVKGRECEKVNKIVLLRGSKPLQ